MHGSDPVKHVSHGQDGQAAVPADVVLEVVLVLVDAKLFSHRLVDVNARWRHAPDDRDRFQLQVKVGVGQGGGNITAAVAFSEYINTWVDGMASACLVKCREIDVRRVDATGMDEGSHVHVADTCTKYLFESRLRFCRQVVGFCLGTKLAVALSRHLCLKIAPVCAH